jgi:hypothetical protein
VGEYRRDSGTAEVDHCWSVVADVVQWWSVVGARVEQGRQHCDCHVTTQRDTPAKETPEIAETHIEKRLKRLWVSIGENLKRLRCTSIGRWWVAWVNGARWWVLGSSKATNVACSAVLDADTVRKL